MNREIKFRFWNCVEGASRMFYDIEQVMECLKQQIQHDNGHKFGYSHVADGSAFMQFTGLKDKNGNDIYESDICKIYDPYNENEKVFVVEYKNGGFIVEWYSMFCGGEADCTTIGWAIDSDFQLKLSVTSTKTPNYLTPKPPTPCKRNKRQCRKCMIQC